MADIKELAAALAETVTEVKRLSAVQDALGADAIPWASWVNDNLAGHQSEMMQMFANTSLALDEVKSRLYEAEKSRQPRSQHGKCRDPKTWNLMSLVPKKNNDRSFANISWTSRTRSTPG